MRVGRLHRHIDVSLVIESDSEESGVGQQPVEKRISEDGSPLIAVEGDLCVLNCDTDDETSMASSWEPPRPRSAKEFMKARAQQCVVCMEEKEHTFVPPHKEAMEGSHVASHRFCTDCWPQFLMHSLSQHRQAQRQRRQATVPALACPMCRCEICVPDAWTLGLELPPSWKAPAVAAGAQAAAGGAGLLAATASGPEDVCTWAEAAPGAFGSRSSTPSGPAPSLPSGDDAECLEGAGGGQVAEGAEPTWCALGCKVPAWCAALTVRRLCGVFTGKTAPVDEEGEDDDVHVVQQGDCVRVLP